MRPGDQKKLVLVILATGDSARTEASPQTWMTRPRAGAPPKSPPPGPAEKEAHKLSRGKTHFADLNGTGGPWETGQTCLKG